MKITATVNMAMRATNVRNNLPRYIPSVSSRQTIPDASIVCYCGITSVNVGVKFNSINCIIGNNLFSTNRVKLLNIKISGPLPVIRAKRVDPEDPYDFNF